MSTVHFRDMPVEPSSFWMYDSSLVREPPKGAGPRPDHGWAIVGEADTLGGREGSGSKMERAASAERRGWWQQEREWVPWEGWRWSMER